MTLRMTFAMSMIGLPLATLAASPAAGQSVEPPPRALPVDCAMGRVCHIQN